MNFKYKTTKEFLIKSRTKKQYTNMLRVLYGKKKDRGYYKVEYFLLKKQEKKTSDIIFNYICSKYNILNPTTSFLGSSYSMFFGD